MLAGIACENGWLARADAPEIDQGVFSSQRLYRHILNTYFAMRGRNEMDFDAALTELTAALLNKGLPAGNGREYPTNENRLRIVLDYMRTHLDAPIRLDDLSEIADVSKFHLIRTFKTTLGLAPGKYHMQLRLIEARNRLREGHDIQDVSFDLGFYDQSHFINAFRKVLGVSPLRFAASRWSPFETVCSTKQKGRE